MAKRLLRWGIILSTVLVVLMAAGLFSISYYINTPDFRSWLTATLTEAAGREVQLEGKLDIAVLTGLALEVNGLTIGDDPAFGSEPFIQLERVSFHFAMLPLAVKELVLESVFVDGLQVKLVRNEAGIFNVQSLLDMLTASSDNPTQESWNVSLRHVEVANTTVNFWEKRDNSHWQLSGFSLRTGDIAPGIPVPVTLESGLSVKPLGLTARVALSGRAFLNADQTGVSLKDAMVTASVEGDFLPEGADPGELSSKVSIDWDTGQINIAAFQARLLGLRADGKLKSDDFRKGVNLEGQVTVHPFNPAQLLAQFAPDLPFETVDGLKSGAFTALVHIDETQAGFKDLVATLDDITVRGDLGINYAGTPFTSFSLQSDTIDADRYMPLFGSDDPAPLSESVLPDFGGMRGQGIIHMVGLKFMEMSFDDIRFKLNPDQFDTVHADTTTSTASSVENVVELVIKDDKESASATVAVSASITTHSPPKGFPFLQMEGEGVGGPGTLGLAVSLPPTPCPAGTRLMEILNSASGHATAHFLNGYVSYKAQPDTFKKYPFSDLSADVKIKPGKGLAGYWNPSVTALLRLQEDGSPRSLSVDAEGGLSLSVDTFHLITHGLAVKGGGDVAELPEKANRVAGEARISFDSRADSMRIEDCRLHMFEATAVGHTVLSGLKSGAVKAVGVVSLAEADIKKAISLFSGEEYATKDPEALRKVSVTTRFVVDETGFSLTDIKGDIDGAQISGEVAGDQYENPLLIFTLKGGKLDIDRYLPPSSEKSKEKEQQEDSTPPEPVDLPLDFLRSLRFKGDVSFDELKFVGFRTQDFTADFRADRGQLAVSRIRGTTYDGRLNADFNSQVKEEYLIAHLQMDAKNMNAGPMSEDMGGKEYLKGVANVSANLTCKGATDLDLLRHLNGVVKFKVNDGSFKLSGFQKEQKAAAGGLSKQDIERMERRAKARTPFDEVVVNFDVHNGVFNATTLRLDGPALTSRGEGSFSLPENSIEMSIQNDLVALPSVTVKLRGRLTDPDVDIPTGEILTDTVGNVLSLPVNSLGLIFDLFTP